MRTIALDCQSIITLLQATAVEADQLNRHLADHAPSVRVFTMRELRRLYSTHLATRFPAGKISPKRPRKSAARDARNVRKSGLLERSGDFGSHPSLVDNTTHPHNPTIPSPYSPIRKGKQSLSKSWQKHVNADIADKRRLARWADTGDLSKMHAAGAAIPLVQQSEGLAFTLNLSGDVAAYVDANPGKAKSRLHKRLSNALNAEFGAVEFVSVLEVSPSGRLHVHGILALPESAKVRAARALEKAGGIWTGKGALYQADTRRLWNAAGWTRYCSKALSRTRRIIGSSPLSMTRNLRQHAESYWNDCRRRELDLLRARK